MDARSAELEGFLRAVGEVLADRGMSAEIVVVGGSALVLTGLAPNTRTTKDVDVLAVLVKGELRSAETFSAELTSAVDDVGKVYGLPEGWLNGGPTLQLTEGLPPDFQAHLTPHDFGGLRVWLPSRFDQICLKMHAAADPSIPNKHLEDLRNMPGITSDELNRAADWATTVRQRRDPRQRVANVLEELLSTV